MKQKKPQIDPAALDADTVERAYEQKNSPGAASGNGFRDRWNELWSDKRKFGVRAGLAALASLAFAFTFIVFGPFELYISNMQYLTFYFNQMVLPIVLAGIAVFAVLFLVLICLKGKVFNTALTTLFAVTLAGYLQGNLLNADHGTLNGDSIAWHMFTTPAMTNLLVWAAIFLAAFLVLYFSRKIWAHAIQLISVMIIGAQIVALTSLLTTTDFTMERENLFVSDKGLSEVANQKNVIFFLLDRFDTTYADAVLEEYPDVVEGLNGFTYYHNFTGSYSRTMPSITYLLSGCKTNYSKPHAQYFQEAWEQATFLKDLKAAGNKVNIYTDPKYVFGKPEAAQGHIDNLASAQFSVNNKLLYKYMFNLSAYRYAPEVLKPFFWLYTGDLQDIASPKKTEAQAYRVKDIPIWKRMWKDDGLSLNEEVDSQFSFIHLLGAHTPYTMDENCNEAAFSDSHYARGQQIKGNMKMIFRYIDELKKMGLYDDATIIISADHGYSGNVTAADAPRMLALFIKHAHADPDAPLQYSEKQVGQDNLRASIAAYCGVEGDAYGRTIESIGEDEEMKRYFFMQCGDAEHKHRDYEMVTYEITGNGNDLANWKEVLREKIQYPFYDAG